MTIRYAAVMEQADFGGFGVWFPDFPGCVCQGEDPMAAAEAASKTLTAHVGAIVAKGEAIPKPTPAEAVELPQDTPAYVFLVQAEAPEPKPAYVRLNVTLPAALVRRIDAVAGGNRSGWLAMAADEQLKRYAVIPNYAASVFSARDNR